MAAGFILFVKLADQGILRIFIINAEHGCKYLLGNRFAPCKNICTLNYFVTRSKAHLSCKTSYHCTKCTVLILFN